MQILHNLTLKSGDGCETSRLPHFLDNRLTDVGVVFGIMSQPTCVASGKFLI
jgi:hypothetical protein